VKFISSFTSLMNAQPLFAIYITSTMLVLNLDGFSRREVNNIEDNGDEDYGDEEDNGIEGDTTGPNIEGDHTLVAPHKPELDYHAILSPRPRKVILKWKMDWKESDELDFPERRIDVHILETPDGKEIRRIPSVELKYDATTYTYTHQGDYGTTLEFTVEAIGNEEYSTESSPVQVKFRKIKPIAITDLKSSITSGKIKLSWKVKGIRENENPVYDVAIYARSDYGNPAASPVSALTSEKTYVMLPIETFRKYVVEVVAVLEGYFGSPSTLNITVLDPHSSPTNVLLTFKSPESVTISFTVPPQMNPDIKDEGCEVNVCPSQALSESCRKELVTQDLSSASFNVKHSEAYYTTVVCKTDGTSGPRSPWLFFTAPTLSKRTVPGVAHYVESGINVFFDAEDTLNLVLSWKFSFSNGSEFKNAYVKWIRISSYAKARNGVYVRPDVVSQDAMASNINLGLSPSLTFDIGCHFYSLNVTFIDGFSSFISSEETCYGYTSASFIILYMIGGILVLVAIVCVITSGRTKKYVNKRRGHGLDAQSTFRIRFFV
uniref:Fibronectin type-III domain-containing protein n=1 Tax=Haemonchus contortus TaxID=6289 RepID=A0A7I4Y2U3_HAECO